MSLKATVCKKQLRSGDNKISVVISKNINKVAGTRWDPKKRRKVKYYSNDPGKVVSKAAMSCTLKL